MFTELCNYHRYLIPDHLHPSKEKPNPLVVTLPCLLPQRQRGRRKWQSIPVFLPGEFFGQRSLVGYSPWGRKESDSTGEHSLFCSLKPLATTHLLCMELPILDILHKWNPTTCDLL